MRIKPAVCLIAFSDEGKILSVTRRNTDIWSLPGGKVDDGESNIEALIREVKEETGFTLHWSNLTPVYSEIILGDDGNHFYCVAYLLTKKILGGEETWECEPGIKVKFIEKYELIENGCFKEYNIRALHQADYAEIALGSHFESNQ